MIQLPRELTDNNFYRSLKPGSVIRMAMTFPDGESSIKRFIVLSRDNNETVIGVLGTSQIESQSRYNQDRHLIKSGGEVFEVDTFVQLHRVFQRLTEDLLESYNKKKIDILGEIDQKDLNQIYKIVANSKVIAKKDIARIILPEV